MSASSGQLPETSLPAAGLTPNQATDATPAGTPNAASAASTQVRMTGPVRNMPSGSSTPVSPGSSPTVGNAQHPLIPALLTQDQASQLAQAQQAREQAAAASPQSMQVDERDSEHQLALLHRMYTQRQAGADAPLGAYYPFEGEWDTGGVTLPGYWDCSEHVQNAAIRLWAQEPWRSYFDAAYKYLADATNWSESKHGMYEQVAKRYVLKHCAQELGAGNPVAMNQGLAAWICMASFAAADMHYARGDLVPKMSIAFDESNQWGGVGHYFPDFCAGYNLHQLWGRIARQEHLRPNPKPLPIDDVYIHNMKYTFFNAWRMYGPDLIYRYKSWTVDRPPAGYPRYSPHKLRPRLTITKLGEPEPSYQAEVPGVYAPLRAYAALEHGPATVFGNRMCTEEELPKDSSEPAANAGLLPVNMPGFFGCLTVHKGIVGAFDRNRKFVAVWREGWGAVSPPGLATWPQADAYFRKIPIAMFANPQAPLMHDDPRILGFHHKYSKQPWVQDELRQQVQAFRDFVDTWMIDVGELVYNAVLASQGADDWETAVKLNNFMAQSFALAVGRSDDPIHAATVALSRASGFPMGLPSLSPGAATQAAAVVQRAVQGAPASDASQYSSPLNLSPPSLPSSEVSTPRLPSSSAPTSAAFGTPFRPLRLDFDSAVSPPPSQGLQSLPFAQQHTAQYGAQAQAQAQQQPVSYTGQQPYATLNPNPGTQPPHAQYMLAPPNGQQPFQPQYVAYGQPLFQPQQVPYGQSQFQAQASTPAQQSQQVQQQQQVQQPISGQPLHQPATYGQSPPVSTSAPTASRTRHTRSRSPSPRIDLTSDEDDEAFVPSSDSKLYARPAKFVLGKDDFDNYYYNFTMFVKNTTQASKRAEVAEYYLGEKAASIWQALKRQRIAEHTWYPGKTHTRPITYDQFLEEARVAFGAPDVNVKARQALDTISYKSYKTYNEYWVEFNALLSKTRDMDTQTIISLFLKGLPEADRSELRTQPNSRKPWSTFYDLTEYYHRKYEDDPFKNARASRAADISAIISTDAKRKPSHEWQVAQNKRHRRNDGAGPSGSGAGASSSGAGGSGSGGPVKYAPAPTGDNPPRSNSGGGQRNRQESSSPQGGQSRPPMWVTKTEYMRKHNIGDRDPELARWMYIQKKPYCMVCCGRPITDSRHFRDCTAFVSDEECKRITSYPGPGFTPET